MAVLSSPLQIISSTPPATRTFTALLVLLSAVYYWLQWRQSNNINSSQLIAPYLTLVPGISWMYPWTVLSASFIEKSVIELAFSLICLPVSLRYLERLWGSLETFKFVGIVLVVSNILAFALSWIEYVALGLEFFVYGMEYHGQMALQTGVLVAFTQMIPEHQVQLFGVLKMRVKRLPMIYVNFSVVLCLVGYQEPFILIQIGWLVAWVYLRFYKRTGSDSTVGGSVEYGDRSETFAFIHWFPPFLHFPVSIIANAAHSLALRLRLIPSHSTPTADVEAGTYSPLPGGARAEAERRRAMALKALDQRLANPAQNPGASGAPSTSTSTNPPSVPPQRQNSSTPPQHQPSHNKLGAVVKSSVPASRPDEPDGEADLGVVDKGAKASGSGTT